MMKALLKVSLLSALALALSASPALAEDSRIQRARKESDRFARVFNRGDARRLAKFYVQNGVLKLPGQRAIRGRRNVEEGWGGALRVLTNLSLFSQRFELNGSVNPKTDRVLETGEFRLEIRVDGGLQEQRGTFAVEWLVPKRGRARPRISFDTIDAN